MKLKIINIKRLLALAMFIFSIQSIGYGQDIHFSQFFQAPLLVNPSLTGVFNGDQRAIVQYRNQWNEFAPYTTYSFSIDGGLFKKKMKDKYIGAGLYIFQDKAGEANLKTTQVHLSLSSVIAINKQQDITAGIQGGFGQNTLDESNMQWGSQYDGAGYGGGISGEENIFENYGFGDFSAGVAWNYGTGESNISKNNHFSANIGAAVYHINAPKQGLLEEPLHRQFVVHSSLNIGLPGTPLSLLPSFYLLSQGPLKQINTGVRLRYMITEESKYTGILKESAASIGMYYRAGDALIPTFMLEYGSYALGISYDINVSSLQEASNRDGGVELSLRFINPNPFKYGRGKKYSTRGLL